MAEPTKEEIELAEEFMIVHGGKSHHDYRDALAQALADVRERCAGVADKQIHNTATLASKPVKSEAAHQIAAAIRKGDFQ